MFTHSPDRIEATTSHKNGIKCEIFEEDFGVTFFVETFIYCRRQRTAILCTRQGIKIVVRCKQQRKLSKGRNPEIWGRRKGRRLFDYHNSTAFYLLLTIAFGAVWFKRVEYSKKQCDVLVVVGAVVEIYKSEKVETPLSADVQKYNQFLNQVFIENNKGKLSLDNREGYCEVDAGHILADSLGGDPLIRNTFPQDPGENVGQVWRNLERMIGDICVGKPNRVFWYFEYTDSKATRPRQIHVELQSACLEKRFATFIIKNYLDLDVIKSPYTVEQSDTSVNTPCDFAKVFPDANGKDQWEYTHILEDGGKYFEYPQCNLKKPNVSVDCRKPYNII